MAAAFVPKAYTNGKRTEIANSPQEEANLLWDGWWVTGSYTPPVIPQYVVESELAPVAKTGAYADLSGKPTVPTAASLAAAPELKAAYVALGQLAASPDLMAVGTITRSATGAATGFGVVWPDGATGTFTGTESTSTPGAIDSYTVTHVAGGVTVTYTQPALTRGSNGAVTARPAMTVA